MKNRPNKPGPWLIEAKGEPTPWCVQISSDMRVLLPGFSMHYRIEEFENRVVWFIKWLGPAYPPKRVDRYIMNTICDSGGFTNEVEMEKYQTGNWIRYEDVKEYLLDEMEPFETDGCLFANLEQEDNEE
jgi:hypothetical protein